MACGVPVVAVDAWGPRELVADGRTGCLVPPGDAAALADRIAALVRDAALRARLGAAAREAFLAENDPDALAGIARDALYAIVRRRRPTAAEREKTAVARRA
jgi:glycosyltransferase involved in cell wall biosynthesis